MAELIASLSKVIVSVEDVELLECGRDDDCEDVDGRLRSSDPVLYSNMSYGDFFKPKVLIAVEMASFSTESSSEATSKFLVVSSNLE